ncbi:MAG: phasin family protein [Gammaproteobacteria bacterium]|jgi:phasin family protein|uniref:Phasin family protein n=1 Tax=Sphaerotilus montanus TaxID=522889 RepID=A0A7Y9R456_9BURK|nr:phasin family protein [Sphaerotilus montanus]MCX7041124.1 phasin family protein [Gammaproteobacteria bacterium]NYG34925.1 phasin family protein [Sphaerotilus montanus]NZD55479.1 phasin family protein [Sphaerotilus montanus]
MLTPEQFAAANKANLDALVELARKSFEGVEKLVELNLQAVRAAMGDSVEQSKALLAAKDPQSLAALQADLVQPAAEKVTAYGRQVYDIATSTQSEMSKLVESQMAVAQEKILGLVDAAVKNAPAGGEESLAMIKQAVVAANGALVNVQQAAKQALSVAEANFEAMNHPDQNRNQKN